MHTVLEARNLDPVSFWLVSEEGSHVDTDCQGLLVFRYVREAAQMKRGGEEGEKRKGEEEEIIGRESKEEEREGRKEEDKSRREERGGEKTSYQITSFFSSS